MCMEQRGTGPVKNKAWHSFFMKKTQCKATLNSNYTPNTKLTVQLLTLSSHFPFPNTYSIEVRWNSILIFGYKLF